MVSYQTFTAEKMHTLFLVIVTLIVRICIYLFLKEQWWLRLFLYFVIFMLNNLSVGGMAEGRGPDHTRPPQEGHNAQQPGSSQPRGQSGEFFGGKFKYHTWQLWQEI